MFQSIAEKLKSILPGCVLYQKSSRFNFIVFDNIREIKPDEWNNIVKNRSVFSSFEYLKSLQAGAAKNILFRYVLIFDDDKPVAASCFQIIDLHEMKITGLLNESYFNAALKNSNYLNKILFGKNNGTHSCLLVCGSMFSTSQTGLIISDSNLEEEVINSFDRIQRLVEDSLPENFKTIATLVKDFTEPTLFTEKLIANSFLEFEIDPDMVLNVNKNWNSFEDYMEALSSKYRVRANSAILKGEMLTVKELSSDEIQKQSNRINELFDAVFNSAPVRLAKVNADYFLEMKTEHQDNLIFKSFEVNNKVVGYSVAIINKKTLCAHLVGIDYNENKNYRIYQNMLLEYIRDAIQHKLSLINFGRDALEIKSTVGAVPNSLKMYMRFSNTLTNKLAKPFMNFTKPKPWIQRNPFRVESKVEVVS